MNSMRGAQYPTEFEGKRALCELAKRMGPKGFLPGGDGCFSVRSGMHSVLVTVDGYDAESLTQSQFVRIDLTGRQMMGGSIQPLPQEIALHLRIYQENPAVACVLHAYPPQAGALALDGSGASAQQYTPSVRKLGSIDAYPRADYAALAQQAAMICRDQCGMMVQNDGCFMWGTSPLDACQKMEALEYSVSMTRKSGSCAASVNTSGLKGVTALVRPGQAAPQRCEKENAASGVSGTTCAPAKPAGRGKIPEFQMKPHRFTENRDAKAPAAPAPQAAAGPKVHRHSEAGRANSAAPRKAEPAVKAAVISAPAAPQAAPAVQAAPSAPAKHVPVKDVPRAQVMSEVVRRSMGRL